MFDWFVREQSIYYLLKALLPFSNSFLLLYFVLFASNIFVVNFLCWWIIKELCFVRCFVLEWGESAQQAMTTRAMTREMRKEQLIKYKYVKPLRTFRLLLRFGATCRERRRIRKANSWRKFEHIAFLSSFYSQARKFFVLLPFRSWRKVCHWSSCCREFLVSARCYKNRWSDNEPN